MPATPAHLLDVLRNFARARVVHRKLIGVVGTALLKRGSLVPYTQAATYVSVVALLSKGRRRPLGYVPQAWGVVALLSRRRPDDPWLLLRVVTAVNDLALPGATPGPSPTDAAHMATEANQRHAATLRREAFTGFLKALQEEPHLVDVWSAQDLCLVVQAFHAARFLPRVFLQQLTKDLEARHPGCTPIAAALRVLHIAQAAGDTTAVERVLGRIAADVGTVGPCDDDRGGSSTSSASSGDSLNLTGASVECLIDAISAVGFHKPLRRTALYPATLAALDAFHARGAAARLTLLERAGLLRALAGLPKGHPLADACVAHFARVLRVDDEIPMEAGDGSERSQHTNANERGGAVTSHAAHGDGDGRDGDEHGHNEQQLVGGPPGSAGAGAGAAPQPLPRVSILDRMTPNRRQRRDMSTWVAAAPSASGAHYGANDTTTTRAADPHGRRPSTPTPALVPPERFLHVSDAQKSAWRHLTLKIEDVVRGGALGVAAAQRAAAGGVGSSAVSAGDGVYRWMTSLLLALAFRRRRLQVPRGLVLRIAEWCGAYCFLYPPQRYAHLLTCVEVMRQLGYRLRVLLTVLVEKASDALRATDAPLHAAHLLAVNRAPRAAWYDRLLALLPPSQFAPHRPVHAYWVFSVYVGTARLDPPLAEGSRDTLLGLMRTVCRGFHITRADGTTEVESSAHSNVDPTHPSVFSPRADTPHLLSLLTLLAAPPVQALAAHGDVPRLPAFAAAVADVAASRAYITRRGMADPHCPSALRVVHALVALGRDHRPWQRAIHAAAWGGDGGGGGTPAPPSWIPRAIPPPAGTLPSRPMTRTRLREYLRSAQQTRLRLAGARRTPPQRAERVDGGE